MPWGMIQFPTRFRHGSNAKPRHAGTKQGWQPPFSISIMAKGFGLSALKGRIPLPTDDDAYVRDQQCNNYAEFVICAPAKPGIRSLYGAQRPPGSQAGCRLPSGPALETPKGGVLVCATLMSALCLPAAAEQDALRTRLPSKSKKKLAHHQDCALEAIRPKPRAHEPKFRRYRLLNDTHAPNLPINPDRCAAHGCAAPEISRLCR